MPNDADRAGTPAGVFGAGLRFYRTRADLSQKDRAAPSWKPTTPRPACRATSKGQKQRLYGSVSV
jgi:hypothetical protein